MGTSQEETLKASVEQCGGPESPSLLSGPLLAPPGLLGGTGSHFQAAWLRGSGGERKQERGLEHNCPGNHNSCIQRMGRGDWVSGWRPEEEAGARDAGSSHEKSCLPGLESRQGLRDHLAQCIPFKR